MHVKSYCFRNSRYSPNWLQETPYAMKVASKPLCSRERQPTAQDTDKENHRSADERMLGKLPGKLPDSSFYLINVFPEFQIPYLHFAPL